jgi:hypothetical protein
VNAVIKTFRFRKFLEGSQMAAQQVASQVMRSSMELVSRSVGQSPSQSASQPGKCENLTPDNQFIIQ